MLNSPDTNCFQALSFDLSGILGETNRDAAVDLARRGFAVFPCDNAKRPLIRSWPQAATSDLQQIEAWWRQWPDALPGLPCGAVNGLAVVDVDRHGQRDGFKALRQIGIDPETLSPVRVSTPSDGMHLYFKWPEGLGNSAAHLPDGVDLRGMGGYVIAPGARLPDGRGYSLQGGSLSTLPAFPENLRPAEKPRGFDLSHLLGDPPSPVDWPRVREALQYIPANVTYDIWRNVGMALDSTRRPEAFDLFCDWSLTSDRHLPSESELRSQWKSYEKGREGGIGIGTLFDLAKTHGWDSSRKSIEISDDDFDDLPALTEPEKEAKVGIIRAKNGDPKATLHNAILILRRVNKDRDFRLRRNGLTDQDEWRGGPINDADLGLIRVAIEQAGMHNVGADLTAGAVRAVAELHQFHPVKDWLETLQHDGKPRLGTWLTNYLRVDDSPYARAVGRAFLVAMVARIMKPGCKHDHVLVLAGAQGIGKSTACHILGGTWAGDNMPSIRDGAKEAGLYLRGHWLVELAELAPSRKAEAEDLKAFLSRRVDQIRPHYGRKTEHMPRQCVFVGTTNETAFLRDASGGRRFWPVTCQDKINSEALIVDREQLFAEALSAFHAGEAWHLSPELESQAAVEQEAAREEHAWEQPIRRILDGLTEGDGFEGVPKDNVTSGEILSLLGIPVERHSGKNSRDAASILRMFGWKRVKSRHGWSWFRP